MQLLLVYLGYFGALGIPIAYWLCTRFRGPLTRRMLVGFLLQIFWSLAVWAFVYFSWRAGYTDAWMGWGLLLPVNIVGFIYFGAVLAIHIFRSKRPK